MERLRMALQSARVQFSRRADVDLRDASWLMAAQRRPNADLPRHRSPACRLSARNGLHARRTDADHRASVLRVVGLSDDRLLRANRALRHAAGLDVSDRYAAPAGHRRDSRLGPVALSERRAR